MIIYSHGLWLMMKYNSEKESVPAASLPTLEDFVVLEDITCVDAQGSVFEHYEVIMVKKDIFRNGQGRQLSFAPYYAALHCEERMLFLPSFALSCNILVALYRMRDQNSEVDKMLMQYRDLDAGYRWPVQNTVINCHTEKIIHYPEASDFGQALPVNHHRQRTVRTFSKATLGDCLLEEALKDEKHARFVKNVTGLRDPSILVDIAKSFNKAAKIEFPFDGKSNKDTYPQWLSCVGSGFYLDTRPGLYNLNTVRGVREL